MGSTILGGFHSRCPFLQVGLCRRPPEFVSPIGIITIILDPYSWYKLPAVALPVRQPHHQKTRLPTGLLYCEIAQSNHISILIHQLEVVGDVSTPYPIGHFFVTTIDVIPTLVWTGRGICTSAIITIDVAIFVVVFSRQGNHLVWPSTISSSSFGQCKTSMLESINPNDSNHTVPKVK